MSVSSETIMYIVSHKDFDAPQLPGYVPILAGAVKNHASIEVKDNTGNVSKMVEEIEDQDGIHYVKILARE